MCDQVKTEILLLARIYVMSDACAIHKYRVIIQSSETMTYLLSVIEINGALSNHATQCWTCNINVSLSQVLQKAISGWCIFLGCPLNLLHLPTSVMHW